MLEKIKTGVIIFWLLCIAKTMLLMPWWHREPRHQQLWFWLCCPRTRLVKVIQVLFWDNKHMCMEPVSIFFFVDNFNFCRAEFVYEIQKYVYTLCHSHHWYCTGNLYRLYWKVSLWILVAEDPGMQGTRALTATVLTQLSRNLSVSAPEGLRIVYITCRVSRYRDTFLSSYCLRKKIKNFCNK